MLFIPNPLSSKLKIRFRLAKVLTRRSLIKCSISGVMFQMDMHHLSNWINVFSLQEVASSTVFPYLTRVQVLIVHLQIDEQCRKQWSTQTCPVNETDGYGGRTLGTLFVGNRLYSSKRPPTQWKAHQTQAKSLHSVIIPNWAFGRSRNLSLERDEGRGKQKENRGSGSKKQLEEG